MPTLRAARALASALASLPILFWVASAPAQEQLPWQRRGDPPPPRDDVYRPDPRRGYDADTDADWRRSDPSRPYRSDAYAPPRAAGPAPRSDDAYRPPRPAGDTYAPPPPPPTYAGPGQPYTPMPPQSYNAPTYGQPGRYDAPYAPRPYAEDQNDKSFSSHEILGAGHRFFGGVSQGLAKVVEYAFQKQGRPNGYILGQDAGGAFVAGLRYGEGTLYTRDAGTHRVYWQGPSIGYDAGAEGSKVMVLIYKLGYPEEIYQRFAGVDGSAYLVGGVGVTFLQSENVLMAPIRAGVGLRFGANVGYLKYTRRPTWNPF